jgi:DNA-binding transcriptional LysR family regulator
LLVLEKKGVAVLPAYLVQGDLKAKRLLRLFPQVELQNDFFRLAFRADDPRQSVFQALAQAMLRVPLGEGAGVLDGPGKRS